MQGPIRHFIDAVLETADGSNRNGSLYIRKCLDAMFDVERWLSAISDRLQANAALGQVSSPEVDDIMNSQQASLEQQHESLSAIVTMLVRSSYSLVEDFFKVLDHMPRIEKWNRCALHYVPVVAALTSEYGSPDGSGTLHDARALNQKIMDGRTAAPWSLRSLQAAFVTWWLAEYSGWYSEQSMASPLQGVDLEKEASERSDCFNYALKDGALQCTLSICSQISPYEWLDPTRTGLINFLLQDAQILPGDLGCTSQYMQTMVLEQIENFVDAFISNMPDTLRRFKADEDSQRKTLLGKHETDAQNGLPVQDLHLERFLIVISFCYENRPEAASSFWTDLDGNLYGFLAWASRRQSTPTVGAFCEMLRSISKGEEYASSAHTFLLDESTATSAKIRRTTSLSWAQILAELLFYTMKAREPPKPSRSTRTYHITAAEDDFDEPESALMLENYLRLMAHLCAESSTVRAWILAQQDLNVLEALLQLCDGRFPSRLQACALCVVTSLLTSKSEAFGKEVWSLLDQWILGQRSLHSLPVIGRSSNPATWMEDVTFATSADQFECLNEFCSLLRSLIEPAEDVIGLNDHVPFPESLGSSYRRPGISPYVDFILGKVFVSLSKGIESDVQRRTISWNILSFVVISLATFNENLVMLGNRMTASVDDAMTASSLSAYIRLHPFARVMEWMFNDRVITALFETSHQPIEEVSNAAVDSPLSLSLVRAIETMNLIMDLQSTYQDLVRPALRSQNNSSEAAVANPSLTSFEDGVLAHLNLIVDLGLYAGLGDQDLASSSLKLLAKLSSARKLNVQVPLDSRRRTFGNRLIGALEQHGELDEIAQSLILALDFDPREIEAGRESPAWKIKDAILDFLYRTILASDNRPSVAHALLGFSCMGEQVVVRPDSLFASGDSLFHAVLHLVEEYPDGDEISVYPWAAALQQKALAVLSVLWSSPLSATLTLLELRSREFLPSLSLIQRPLNQETAFDGRLTRDPSFLISESADTLILSLSFRTCSMKYAAVEWRSLLVEGKPSMKNGALSTFLGSTAPSDRSEVQNANIFDLLDFFELEIPSISPLPDRISFSDLLFDAAVDGEPDEFGAAHNMRLIDEMVKLKYNEIIRGKPLEVADGPAKIEQEAVQIIHHFLSRNNQKRLRSIKYQALATWADLVMLVLKTCDLDAPAKLALTLQVFQIVTAKLEIIISFSSPDAIIVARMVQGLISEIDFKTTSLGQSMAGSVAIDRLFQVFRVSFRGIGCPGLSTQLRETLYRISYQYLAGSAIMQSNAIKRCHDIDTIKHAGEKVLEIICDDAYGANASCRISALLLLDSLAMLATDLQSDYVVNFLVRINFPQILAETIEDIPIDLRASKAQDVPTLLTIYEWKFSLLLTISRGKNGASILINAGIFNVIRISGLFSMDPDIGIEMDNPEALAEYYKLLLAITKIVVSLVISRGSQNEQTKSLARSFLSESRSLIVAVFKRDARIGGVSFDDAGVSIEELVELFVLLIAITDFLEVRCPCAQ